METHQFSFNQPQQPEKEIIAAFRRANIRFVELLVKCDWDINNRQVDYALQESEAIGESLATAHKANRHIHPLQKP